MGWRAAFIALITALLCAAPAHSAVFTVTGTSDGGTCTGTSCASLRAAIAASEATKTEADTINVPAGVININNDLVVQSEMTINGVSARTTIIDGGAKYRGFRVTASGALSLNRFTIRNGAAGGGDITDGGGILNQGVLALQDVRVTNSRAARGGGIANALGRISADNLLVDSNVASGAGGGGIHNTGGSEIPNLQGWLILTDTTVFQNSSGIGGVGGLASTGTGAVVSLSRTTIADNLGGARGIGGLVASGNTQAVGTIVARNLVGSDIVNCDADRRPTDAGFNVEDDKDCNLAPGALKPQLATALSNEGGELDVLTIPTASDAFNRLPTANAACTGSDQRQMFRPQGTACDAGAFEIPQAATVTITEGPTGTITTTGTEFRFQDSGGDVTVQCDLTGPGQTAGFETCYKSNVQPYSGPLADGPYTFSVRAISAGFPNPPVTTRSFVVNAAGAPNTTITGGPTGTVGSTSAAFTYISSETGSTFQCSLDAAVFGTCPASYTGLSQGSHTFRVRATDASGSVDATPATRTWTVDTVAPETTITGGPTGTVSSTSAAFTYTSEAGATFQCAFDGSAFGACPASYTGLSQAPHTFQVRAIDAVGNIDASPATRTWTVDTVAPDTTIGSGPSGATASTTATFTFTSNEASATFQCALDGAAFGACPVSYTGLSQGAHTFQVRATDAANNVDASPAIRMWTVDTVAPDTTITSGPTGPTASTSAAFTYTSTEGGPTFQCALDGSAFGACPASYTGLSQAPHTFQVRAIDAAGNIDATPATRTWTADTVAPTVTIGTSPPRTNDITPSFSFTANETATFECRSDAGTFTGCTSPYTTGDLTEGNHTVEIRAKDAAGNQGAAASRAIVIDLTAPAVTINSGPTGLTNDNTPTYAFTAEAGATFQCRVDSVAFADCTSPHTTVPLLDGGRTFQVRAIDTAGNVGTPVSRAITVDTTAPAAPVITAPAENALLATSTVNMTGTGEANATVQLTEGAVSAGSSPVSGTGTWNVVLTPTDGTHTYTARTTDAAGNPSATTTRTIRIDTQLPDTTILSGPSGTTNDTTPTWTFSSSEAGSTFECALDGVAHTACVTPFTPTLAAGPHTFSVRAVDLAGNRDNTPATRAITIDTTAPTVTITGGPTGPTNNATPTFSFTADAGSTFQCRVDTAPFAGCTNPHTTVTLTEAPHTFEVRATDVAGNSSTDTRSFTVDLTRPNTTLTGGPAPLGSNTSPQFTFTSSESGSRFECSLDTAGFTGCASPHSPGTLGTGEHTYRVRAIDAAGNVDDTPATQTFVIDTSAPPAPSITSAPNTPGNDDTPTFAFTGEAGATFQCRVDTAAFTACTTAHTIGHVDDGDHRFEVRAVDAAGNAGPATSFNFTVDTVLPAAPVVLQPTQNQWLTASAVTVSGTSEAGAFIEIKEGATTRGTATATAGGTWSIPIAVVTDGTHTYAVTARDRGANTSAATNRTFRVDTAAPNAPAITAGAANGSTVTLSGTAEAGATVELYEGAAERGTTTADGNANWSRTLTNVADGSHTYAAKAFDAAGNASPASAGRTVVVDTTGPATTFTAGPTGPTNDPTPTFSFTSEAGATFECRVDASPFEGCASPHTTGTLGTGQHTFEVIATDTTGNAGTPATRTINVDTSAPPVTITGGPEGPTSDTTPTFTFTSEPGATFQCGVDGALAACTSPHTTGVLAQGTHTFRVIARDAAGNSSAVDTREFSVDDGPPAAPAVAGPSGPTNDATPTFTFTGEGRFECSLDGGELEACTSPFDAPALADGAHSFRVKAIDDAGNQSALTVREFVVDTAKPAAAVTGGPDGPTTNAAPAFTFTASDAKTECRLDGPSGPGTYADCVSPKAFNALAPGNYVFFVRVTDPAGNQTESQRPFTVTEPQAAEPTRPFGAANNQVQPPPPVPNQTIVVAPKTGTVLVKAKGETKFTPLDITKGIPVGSEVDVRNGRVTLTSIPKAGQPPQSADFYGGIFIVTQKGGITDLKLSERLTGCPKGQQASLSQKKTKSRKLWGNGKGAFRTTGKYSAATVRGTIWLVQDTCTTTLTRVTQGVVEVNDTVKKTKKLLKKGKSYTARAKKR